MDTVDTPAAPATAIAGTAGMAGTGRSGAGGGAGGAACCNQAKAIVGKCRSIGTKHSEVNPNLFHCRVTERVPKNASNENNRNEESIIRIILIIKLI